MTRMTRTYRAALPDGRLAEPTRLNAQGRRVIDIDTYVPYFLIAVNNALSRGASARYLREFGVGVTEWRVLSWLATEPGIPASRICEVIALDKAAVSRAVARLADMDLIEAVVSPTDPRKRRISPNPAGYALHDRILAAALEREAILIEGVDPDDLEAFLRVMRVMRQNVDRL